jgi:hypothetical protein
MEGLPYDITVRRGKTHVVVHLVGALFIADVYILQRTQEICIARIDNGDKDLLAEICVALRKFKF